MQHDLQNRILDILSRTKDMTLATVRPDGAPQATVVSFANDGMTLYFGCGAGSQKAANIAREPRVSVTVTPPYSSWDTIEGLSMAATAREVTASGELAAVGELMRDRFPQLADAVPPEAGMMKVFHLRPHFVSVLDYGKGFGHTDLVRVGDNDITETLESMAHRWIAGVAQTASD
ncbi:MAG: pyridoxamine 5'-phosphate oxidase family protein [Amaricoccus sp.]